MSVIYDLVNDFINKDKVLPDALLTDDSTIISKHFHHSIYYIHDKTWRDIVFGGSYEVYSELLGEEEVQSLDTLHQ